MTKEWEEGGKAQGGGSLGRGWQSSKSWIIKKKVVKLKKEDHWEEGNKIQGGGSPSNGRPRPRRGW
jgi:hypothetical protein